MSSSRFDPEKTKTIVIGVGNVYRSDDAAGFFVARALSAKRLPGTTILEESGESAALMNLWKGAETVVLIDAVSSGREPGAVHRFEAQQQKIPAKFFHYSTHAFGVAEAVEMARSLKQLPPRLIVYGIEGKNFETGVGLSKEVQRSISEVIQMVLRDLHYHSSRV